MKSLRTLCVCVTLAVSAVCSGQTQATKLPDDIVAFVEVGNMEQAWGHLQSMATAIDPSAMLPPLAGWLPKSLLKSNDPTSVDLRQPFQLAILAPPLHGAPVLVFGATDPQRYLDSLSPAMQKLTAEDGLHLYSDGGQTVAVGTVGNRVIVGINREAVAKAVAMAEAGSWPGGIVRGGDDVAAVLRPVALLEGLSEMGQDPFAALKQTILPVMRATQGPSAMNVEGVLEAEIDAVEAMLRQCDTVVLAASFGADALRVTKQAKLVAGGGISQYVSGLAEGKLELFRYLPSDAIGAVAGKVGNVGPLLDWYGDFLGTLMPAMGAEPGSVEPLMQLMRRMGSLKGDELAQAMVANSDGTVGFVYAMETGDPAALRELLAEVPAMCNSAFGEGFAFFGMDMTVAPDPIIYKGHTITEWEYDFEFRPMPGVPGGEQVAAMQQRMVEEMYGGEMKTYWTFLDDTWLAAYGAGALDRLKSMIDGVGMLEGSDRLNAALAGMPENPAVAGYVSLSDVAGWYMRVLSHAMASVPVPIRLDEITFPDAPDVAFSARMAAEDLIEAQVRVPTATIKALVDGAKAAFAPGIAEARQQAKKAASQANLHNIGLCISIWRADHDESYPPDLMAVVDSGFLENVQDVLVDPNDTTPQPIGGSGLKSSYEYVGTIPANVPPDTIIAYSRKGIWPSGRNVLYADMAVEFVGEAALRGEGRARKTLRASYEGVVQAFGQALTDQDRARLREFYEVVE